MPFGRIQAHLSGDMRMYARFVTGLPAFFRRRVTHEEARDIMRRRLAAREDAFLALVHARHDSRRTRAGTQPVRDARGRDGGAV
jgi:hypothetical protein